MNFWVLDLLVKNTTPLSEGGAKMQYTLLPWNVVQLSSSSNSVDPDDRSRRGDGNPKFNSTGKYLATQHLAV